MTARPLAMIRRLREWALPVAAPPGILTMAILGSLCGGLAGLAISALHTLIDLARPAFLGLAEQTPWAGGHAFVAAVTGAVLIGLIFQLSKARHRDTGIVHIVERLMHHQGHMPARNTWLNFLGTTLALGSGQVVGREGAAMHLGAAGGSWLGRFLDLPNSTVRALVGCGAAAGIAASFNTPLAAVVFTMEVIVMEYSVIGLAPTIIAAVSANAVAHWWLKSYPTLSIDVIAMNAYNQIPMLLLLGLLFGAAAAYYSLAIAQLTRWYRRLPFWLPITLAGLITGLLCLALPGLAEDGFVSMNRALSGSMAADTALALGLAALLLSSLAIASAVPGGIIMPSMLAGACLGSALGSLAAQHAGIPAQDAGVYALLGLGAMMGAVLQAPLTALIVILELSAHTEMVFPAMLTVITAVLVARQLSGSESIVALLLRNRGLDFRNDPVSQSLRRISVITAMNRNFVAAAGRLSLAQARVLLERRPDWFLVKSDKTAYCVGAADVLHAVNAVSGDDADPQATINLEKIPADRRQCAGIYLRASLQEAWEHFERTGAEALYVERQTRHGQMTTYGILTRKAVEKAYRP